MKSYIKTFSSVMLYCIHILLPVFIFICFTYYVLCFGYKYSIIIGIYYPNDLSVTKTFIACFFFSRVLSSDLNCREAALSASFAAFSARFFLVFDLDKMSIVIIINHYI